MSFPAPADPPMTATIKLGTIAKHLVKKFRIHGLSRKSRNPFNKKYKNILLKTKDDRHKQFLIDFDTSEVGCTISMQFLSFLLKG